MKTLYITSSSVSSLTPQTRIPSFDSYKLMNFSIIRTRGKVMNERNALLLHQQRDNNHSPVHKYEPSMGKLVCMSPETTWKSCPQVPGCRKMLGYIY